MKSNNTSAIASWLGFISQEYRLVERLLRTDKRSTLGFELLDDVEEQLDNKIVLEQDKISLTSRNIVVNQSKDLWKTISNWVDLINDGSIDESNVVFLLYTNKEHTSDVLKLLCDANNIDDSKVAYEKIIKYVEKPSDNIKKYVDNFLNLDNRKYTLIANFEYTFGSGSTPTDLEKAYLNINTSITDKSQDVLHEILGWTRDVLTNLAEQKKTNVNSSKSFWEKIRRN